MDPDAIRAKLDRLRERDCDLAVFGASAHRYVLHPVLSERQVAAFERKWKLALPEDYRQFLTEVGNGGAGPCYGVFKLGEHDHDFGHQPWKRGGLVGDPARPFVHRKAWNLPKRIFANKPKPEGMTPEQEDKAWAKWDREVEARVWDVHLMDGAIPICHLGCAARIWLVVTGPRAGEVWSDDRVDDKGIRPVVDRGKRVTLGVWYTQWLDRALASRARRARAAFALRAVRSR
jgi:hypothetical protein